MMNLPIDDVWLTGEPVAAVPSQRLPHADRPVVAMSQEPMAHEPRRVTEPQRHATPTDYLPSTVHHGSNGVNMTPQNRNNGSTNGSENGSRNGARPTHTFDPQSFDPGPDLPPLPTLRPLPTIRPMNRWSLEPTPAVTPAAKPVPAAEPTPAAERAPAAEPTAQVAPAPTTPPADRIERRTHHLAVEPPDEATSESSGRPDAQPVRHRRRATDLTDGAEPALLLETTSQTTPETTPGFASTPAPGPTPAPAPAPAPTEIPLTAVGTRLAQRVLVLGGSGAIGSAVARAMAAQGARVAVHHASHAVEAAELVAALPGDGHLSIGADLADSESVADLIRSVDDKFDGLDVVINAASAGESVSRSSVVGSSLADWTDAWTGTLTVDVLGAATVTHAAAAAFVARGHGGRIILLAAKGRPFSGIPNPVGLATEKAVAALGSVLAGELAPYGIGVTVVGSNSACPSGWSPAALAETVAWLASGPTSALPGAVFDIAG